MYAADDDVLCGDDMLCGSPTWNPWGVICLPVAFLVIILGVVLAVLLADDGDGLVAIGIVFCVIGAFIIIFALIMCQRRQRRMYMQPDPVPPPTLSYASPEPAGYRGRAFSYEAGDIEDEAIPVQPRPRSVSRGVDYRSPYANVQPLDYATGPSPGGRHGVWYPEAPAGFRSPSGAASGGGSMYPERASDGRHVYRPRYSGGSGAPY